MLGKIAGIEENVVVVDLNPEVLKNQTLANHHLVFEDPDKLIVGEVVNIKDGQAYVNLIGELVGERFVGGVIRKPSFGASVKLVSQEKVPLIIGIPEFKENRDLYLGMSPVYPGIKLGVKLNDFFANHFAIFGNTGREHPQAGKINKRTPCRVNCTAFF